MAITNTVFSNLLSAFIDCLDCFLLLPIRCDKGIEIVTSFPPLFGAGVCLRLVAACRNSNRDMYIVCISIRSATFNHQNTE